MKKLLFLSVMLLMVVCCSQPSQYVQISGYAQGSNYSVKLNMKGIKVPVETIRDSIDALIVKIDTTLSGYNKKSLISRFNAGEKIPSNAMFMDVYRLGYRLWERSGGALDFGAAALYDAWGFGFRNSSFPSDEEIQKLLQKSGMGHLPAELPVVDGYIDPASIGYPRLNFNAIAQGYSCDVIAGYLYSLGAKDMLVDIGEIWCDGVNPNGEAWSVPTPSTPVPAIRCSITCSAPRWYLPTTPRSRTLSPPGAWWWVCRGRKSSSSEIPPWKDTLFIQIPTGK